MGQCQFFNAKNFKKLDQFKGWDFQKFQTFCVLAGCDYFKLPGIRGKTAIKYINKYYDHNELNIKYIILHIKNNKNLLLDEDEYIKKFYKALLAFRLHIVYCPKSQTTITLV